MCALQCQTAGHKSVCNQVLWPAYCIESFCHFLESCKKCSVGARITRFTTCFVCGTCLISKFDPNTASTPILSLSHCILKTAKFQSLLLLNFLMPYLVLNLPLPGQVGTAWESAKPRNALSVFLLHLNWQTQTSALCTDRRVLLATCHNIAETGHQRRSCELT